jgi:hypothetical protein
MRKNAVALVLMFLVWPWALQAQQTGTLDTTTFVVIGEGLAAGMADFALRDVYQKNSFPALMAQKFGTAFPQPLIQPPGIGSVPGFAELPVAAPGPWQTSVRTPFPPPIFVFNLAVPGHRLTDALSLRPTPPLIQQSNAKQTITNLLLGYPAMILGTDNPLWSQVEYAVAMNPTLVLVELGYTEVLEAAVKGDSSLMPDQATFRSNYAKVLSALQPTFATVITTTIPDPFDTAYFSTAAAAADLAYIPASTIVSRYGLKDGDLLSPHALFAIGAEAAKLEPEWVVSAAKAAEIRNRVRGLNTEIAAASQQAGAILYDLNGLFARIRASGVNAGNLKLTGNYLGGIYSLSGSYPGWTGHALIANEILALVNQKFGTSFATVDVNNVAPTDPAVRFRPFLP